MRLVVRKLPVEDAAKLQALVVENFDAIEPGLSVLDARLLLGHSTIDVIGVDAAGSLVLGAIGFIANEEMLLKAVETYSWCLEYPESLVRHYPSCHVSEDRPPRLLFVVERVPDAFHRKIKQLGFPEVDCVEIRHLEFDGVPAVYFETLLRLRRGAAPAIHRATEPERAAASNLSGEAAPARVSVVKLQRLANSNDDGGTEASAGGQRPSERPAPSREHAPVVSMVSRQAAATARVERPRPAAEALIAAEPEPLLAEPDPESPAAGVPMVAAVAVPASTDPIPSLETPTSIVVPSLESELVTFHGPAEGAPRAAAPTAATEPRVSFKHLASTLLGAEGTGPAAAPTGSAAIAVEEPAVELMTAAVEIAPDLTAPEPQIEEASAAPASPLTVETLVAGAATVATPSSQQSAGAGTAKQPPVPGLPQEFEGLKFPNDGVLTRQWMEFLNQMSGTK